jgi:ribosomal protein S27E
MTDETTQRFLIGVAADADDFVRQQCAQCGLDFKMKVDPSDQNDGLSWWFQEAVREASGGDEESNPYSAEQKVYCPYCGTTAPPQDFVHPEVVSYVRRMAHREVIEPMLAQLFQGFTSGLRSSKYLKVTVTQATSRSPRPISGPEPDDQVRVRCLACHEQFKVDESWRGSVFCAACRTELLPQ